MNIGNDFSSKQKVLKKTEMAKKEVETPAKTTKSSEGMWKIFTVILFILLILILISRVRLTISAQSIGLLLIIAIGIIVAFYLTSKPKPSLDVFKSAREIAQRLYTEGTVLDTRNIRAFSLGADDILIEFPINNQIFHYNRDKSIKGVDNTTLFQARKEYEQSEALKHFLASELAEKKKQKKLEELGLSEDKSFFDKFKKD